MSALLDTGILYAYYDRRDAWHERSRELIRSEPGDLIVPSPVIPEVDHLLGHRLGDKSQTLFYASLVKRDYTRSRAYGPC